MAKWQRTKHIDGETYHFYSSARNKTEAKQLVAKLRKGLYRHIRTFKTSQGYEIYTS